MGAGTGSPLVHSFLREQEDCTPMVDKSEKIEWLARLGYGVRGLVYILLGYLAISSIRSDEVAAGPSGVLEYVQSIPGGTAVLYISAAGLIGYALYKLIASLFDTERYGTDIKGIGHRVAFLISAVIYSGLALTALQLANGSKHQTGGRAQDLASTTLTFSIGEIVLAIAAIGLAIGAAFQAKSAITASFMKHISAGAPRLTCYIGRVGLGARAIVFALMSWSLAQSAWSENGQEVRSVGQALLDLRDMGIVYTLVALGLMIFGVFSLITARYRIISDPDPNIDFKGKFA